MTTQAVEPAAVEALHLRRLIEQQPACLLRVGIDGLLLAVNEAALKLLGGEALTQVLGSKLTKLIMPRQHEEWQEFAARVRDGVSGSIECDLNDLSGMRRTMLLQAVPLLDHADGVPSMILTARDISAPRRLEASLREREMSRELDDLQKELQQGFLEPAPGNLLDDRGASVQPVIVPAMADGAEYIQLRQTLTEQHEAALVLKEQQAEELLNTVRGELEQALAEHLRLTTLLDDREIGHQRMVAVHAAEQTQLQQRLTEEHQTALELKEREAQQLLERALGDLEEARAEHERLTALVNEREVVHQRALAAHAVEQGRIQQTLTEEHQEALRLNEREAQQQVSSVRTELEEARAEQQRLAISVDERAIIHQRTLAAHAAERAQLQQTLTEEHQAVLLLKEQEAQHVLEGVRAELEQAVAAYAGKQAQLQTLAEEHQLALLLKGREAQQLLNGVRAELEQARTEQQRLTILVDDRETAHQRAVSAHAAAHALAQAQLRQSLTEEHRRALLLKEREGKQRLEGTRSELEQALAAALVKQTELEKALADQRVELQTVEGNARILESLAAGGRVALAVGRELQTVVGALDARTQSLLVESALDAGNRHVIEALRVDALEAASLARQILQIQSEPQMIADASEAGTDPLRASGDAGTEP
jgi:PAS domain S-box-containing protein